MMEKKIINLDALIDNGQTILLDGKEYILSEASVVQLLDFVRKAESVNDMEKLVLVIEMLYELCPAAKENRAFDKLKMKQVQSLFDTFVMGTIESPIAKVAEVTPSTDTEAKKK